ncbi:flavoprotein [Nocardia pneumoniae]|uniref:flavoprotein n=1 Tax=Nocardia pneumoniae TaxID=228601 RepID=UPI0003075621|nr:flavoprotein [Nocardia pneumoniae]
MNDQRSPVLYVIVTGATPANEVGELVAYAQADGWDVCVIASPNGYRFIDADALAALTGHPVRSQFKEPGTLDVLPPPDAVIAAPITANSLAKWSLGIADTLPVGMLVEAVGRGLPVVAVPYAKPELLRFPALRDAVGKLSEWGVTVVDSGDAEPDTVGWGTAWKALLAHPALSSGK